MSHKFTHKGYFCGVVPIYLDMTNEEAPLIVERHWSFLPLFILIEFVFGICVFLRTMVDREYEPMYPLKITGEYED
jgi:hypothetical protein